MECGHPLVCLYSVVLSELHSLHWAPEPTPIPWLLMHAWRATTMVPATACSRRHFRSWYTRSCLFSLLVGCAWIPPECMARFAPSMRNSTANPSQYVTSLRVQLVSATVQNLTSRARPSALNHENSSFAKTGTLQNLDLCCAPVYLNAGSQGTAVDDDLSQQQPSPGISSGSELAGEKTRFRSQ